MVQGESVCHSLEARLSPRLGKRLQRVPTLARLVPLGSAERVPEGTRARGAAHKPASGPCTCRGSAWTATAPGSQQENEVGWTLSPAPSGDKDSERRRDERPLLKRCFIVLCHLYMRLVKTSGREHLEGDSQITSKHLRSSKFRSPRTQQAATEAKDRGGDIGRLTGARPLAHVCSCSRCACCLLASQCQGCRGREPAATGSYAEAHRWVSAASRCGWRAQPGLPQVKCACEFPGGCYSAGSESTVGRGE